VLLSIYLNIHEGLLNEPLDKDHPLHGLLLRLARQDERLIVLVLHAIIAVEL